MIIRKVQGIGLAALAFLAPTVAFADDTDIFDIIGLVINVVNLIIPLIVGIAVLLFLWGLAVYIMRQDNQEARAGARNRMFWGIVILFVMVSLWGLVNLLDETFGLNNAVADVPGIPGADGAADCDGIICADIDIDILPGLFD